MRGNREQHSRFIKAPCHCRSTDALTVFAACVFGYLRFLGNCQLESLSRAA
jgi:hypothetical protein